MGSVASIALAMPFARLCPDLPAALARGPYLSGCRCARTAPVTMIMMNRAVIIPVIEYRIIIATAVVGEGPPKNPLPLKPPPAPEEPLSLEKEFRSGSIFVIPGLLSLSCNLAMPVATIGSIVVKIACTGESLWMVKLQCCACSL